jgi:putative transposase
MVKLNKTKIKWLVRQVIKKDRKPSEVASVYNLSTRRIQQLVKYFKQTGEMPMLKKSRRPKTFLTLEQKELIYKNHLKHKVGARLLKIALDEDHPNNRISKNKIHEYLSMLGFSNPDKKKQKQRKRCRYERKHSGSLGHMDSHECKWKDNLQLISFLDDASRKILAAVECKQATAKNAVAVVDNAVKEAWKHNLIIKQVNTDHGSEFMSNHKVEINRHQFLDYLDKKGIKHIPSRVNNPQTNGKLERWHQEYIKHRASFSSLEEFIGWYNDRIHGEIKTRPNRAYINKLPPESILGSFTRSIQHETKK